MSEILYTTYDSAKAALDALADPTIDQLRTLVQQTSAVVEGAPSNATSLLYAGTLSNGEQAWEAAKSVAESTAGNTGAERFVRVDDTPVGQLLFDDRKRGQIYF